MEEKPRASRKSFWPELGEGRISSKDLVRVPDLLGGVAHTYNPIIGEAETGGFLGREF